MSTLQKLQILVAITISFMLTASGRCQPAFPESAKPVPVAKQVRTDLFGDALPPGAIARMGTVRLRHEAQVSCVAFAPDGKTVASASEDKTVRLWDTATGKEIHQLRGHQRWVNSVVFSPDGKMVASASADHTVRLWDAASGKEIRQLPETSAGLFKIVQPGQRQAQGNPLNCRAA